MNRRPLHLMRALLALLAMVAMLSAPGRAAEEATPEGIAKRQIEGMHDMDWVQVAAFTHPRALAQVKALFLPVAKAGAAAAPSNPAAAQMMQTLFGGKKAEALDEESPADFFRTVMSGLAEVLPDFRQSMQSLKAEMIGHVDEGTQTAHVVYRLSRTAPDGSTATRMAVLSVERDGVAWKALLSTDLEPVARAISARLNSR